jgi:DNA repair protein RadA/Sms
MAKSHTVFACVECGYKSPRWLGRCPGCETFGSLVEEADNGQNPAPKGISGPVLPLCEIPMEGGDRISSGMPEFDRALGGGVVPGSLVLVGGDPGIGKSTLMLQAADRLFRDGRPVLYASAEESGLQIRMRAERLGLAGKGITVAVENDVERLLAAAAGLAPSALIVDSIQTVYLPSLGSAPGSVAQVRESAARFLVYAKSTGTAVFLVGHVTKEGAIAGPRTLEHMVDTVLYFEGDRQHLHRILRAVKNRFGAANEIGVFMMGERGLTGVENPSALFLHGEEVRSSGTVVTPVMEGTRPMLVEIQALVSPTAFGSARRTVSGVDVNRLHLIAAVLERRVGIRLSDQDIFLNLVGGMRIAEPGLDLPLALAIWSSFSGTVFPGRWVAFGEIGLGGEVRPVARADERIREAQRQGFDRALVPSGTALDKPSKGIEVVKVRSLEEALEAVRT